MDISKELVDDLNAVIRLRISPNDYQPKIDQQLKEYSKKVNMPGFRPGKVPAGMIRKMYGKSILAEELNKITSDSLFNYIRDNQLDILGNPLPHPDNDRLDLENPGEINFAFEVGFAPQFSLDISSNHSFNFYSPKIDDTILDETINGYRERLGESAPVETSEKGDTIEGALQELDSTGNPVPDSIHNKVIDIRFDDIELENQAEFVGLTVGQSLKVNLNDVIKSSKILSDIMELPEEQAEALTSDFQFTVESIKRKVPAELNQEFFDKLFGKDTIFSDGELREKIRTDMAKNYRRDSEARFFNEVVEHLVNSSNFQLPDSFLKRWLTSINEGKIEASDIENNYNNYSKGIRWQLIEGKILKDNSIVVTQDQIVDSFTTDFLGYMGVGENASEDMRARAREIAMGMLKNEKEVKKVYDRLYNEAMTALFLSEYDVRSVELPFEDWAKQLNEPIN